MLRHIHIHGRTILFQMVAERSSLQGYRGKRPSGRIRNRTELVDSAGASFQHVVESEIRTRVSVVLLQTVQPCLPGQA